MLTGARRRGSTAAPGGEWSRARLLAAVAGLAVLGMALVAGAALWVWFRVHPASPAAAGTPAPASGGAPGAAQDTASSRRDALAAAPMPSAPPQAARPAVLSTRDPGVIVLPPATGTGPAGVPTGFPRTPAGALAQLAAIDKNVLDTGTIDHARAVAGAWAAPGGPTGASWSAVKALASFHSAAGLSGGTGSGAVIRATPMMGLVKATDGPEWAVVCVNLHVQATIAQTARVAAADCQRMSWEGGRWVLGPGPEPAPGPSIWPGTDAAIDAGYQTLRQG